jgi:hypothetical protein
MRAVARSQRGALAGPTRIRRGSTRRQNSRSATPAAVAPLDSAARAQSSSSALQRLHKGRTRTNELSGPIAEM